MLQTSNNKKGIVLANQHIQPNDQIFTSSHKEEHAASPQQNQ